MDCFVIMPFGPGFDRVYDSIKSVVGDQCLRIDERHAPGNVLEELVSELESASFCIADLSGYRPNVMWEVGYAMALGKPVILITQDTGGLPFDLAPNRVFRYVPDDLSGTLAPQLDAALEALRGPSARFTTSTWDSMKTILDGPYSPVALERLLEAARLATGQRLPRVRLWGNSRAVGVEDGALFRMIGSAIGAHCAKMSYPIIGSSDDDRTLEASAFQGACEYLKSHSIDTEFEFIVHSAVRGNRTRPFQGVSDHPPLGPRMVHVEYPFRDGQRLQKVSTGVRSERDDEHDARLGSLLQADIVVLLGAAESARNMLEMIVTMESSRLRAAPPHVLLPMPWIPGMGRLVHSHFTGRIDSRLLRRIRSLV